MSVGPLSLLALALGGISMATQPPEVATPELQSTDLGTVAEETKSASPEASPSPKSSLDWMTQSLQRVARKLESISEKIEPEATQEQIERKVKEAFQEAFSEIASEGGHPAPPKPPQSPRKNRSSKLLQRGDITVVEVDSDADIMQLQSGSLAEISPLASANSPYLSESAPPWVRGRMLTDDVVRLPISSSFFSTVEECREDLNERLLPLVRDAIVEEVLQSDRSVQLAPLTKDYIVKHLLRPDTEFDNTTDRPGGPYHQLYQLIQIGPEQLREIQSWERNEITRKRAEQLGAGSVVAMGLITSLSGCVRLLARREQRLRAKKQANS